MLYVSTIRSDHREENIDFSSFCFQCSFYLFHLIKGAPWETCDQGLARRFTFWEQIDNGIQWTGTRKFLQIVPIVL